MFYQALSLSACNFEKLGVAWLARLLGGTQQVVHLKESDDVRVVQPLHTGDLTRQQLPSMLVQLSLVYDLHSNLLCKRRGRERERERDITNLQMTLKICANHRKLCRM